MRQNPQIEIVDKVVRQSSEEPAGLCGGRASGYSRIMPETRRLVLSGVASAIAIADGLTRLAWGPK
jgi:hypothetical protein